MPHKGTYGRPMPQPPMPKPSKGTKKGGRRK